MEKEDGMILAGMSTKEDGGEDLIGSIPTIVLRRSVSFVDSRS